MNISFTVTINYTHDDDDGVICPDSMRDNLALFVNNYHGLLTPENIVVNAVEVSLSQQILK